MIVQLDDVPLGKGQYLDLGLDNTIGGNIWTTYLLPNDKSDAELERWNQGRGWCVDESAVGGTSLHPGTSGLFLISDIVICRFSIATLSTVNRNPIRACF